VNQRRVRDLDDLIDDPTAFQLAVSDEEWKVLGADEMTPEGLAEEKHKKWMAKQSGQTYKRKIKKKRKAPVKINNEDDDQEEEYGVEEA
jgi:hypothetical protein